MKYQKIPNKQLFGWLPTWIGLNSSGELEIRDLLDEEVYFKGNYMEFEKVTLKSNISFWDFGEVKNGLRLVSCPDSVINDLQMLDNGRPYVTFYCFVAAVAKEKIYIDDKGGIVCSQLEFSEKSATNILQLNSFPAKTYVTLREAIREILKILKQY